MGLNVYEYILKLRWGISRLNYRDVGVCNTAPFKNAMIHSETSHGERAITRANGWPYARQQIQDTPKKRGRKNANPLFHLLTNVKEIGEESRYPV